VALAPAVHGHSHSGVQPTYTGYSARNCVGDPDPIITTDACAPVAGGPIGTLPWYYENGLLSNGDPELAFGPKPGAGGFSGAPVGHDRCSHRCTTARAPPGGACGA
jgi:hypothetical protein